MSAVALCWTLLACLSGYSPAAEVILSTADGLALHIPRSLKGNEYLSMRGEPMGEARGGLWVRDMHGSPTFVPLPAALQELTKRRAVFSGSSVPLGLAYTIEYQAAAGHITIRFRLRDLTGRDRALRVEYRQAVAASGGRWYDDVRHWRVIRPGRVYHGCSWLVDALFGIHDRRLRPIPTRFSRYPLCTVTTDRYGISLAVPVDEPRMVRLVYAQGACIAGFDLGLSPDTLKFPSQADASVVIYAVDREWGFRDALQRYYRIFPRILLNRAPRHGATHPTGKISALPNYQDFHFSHDWQFPIFPPSYYRFCNRRGIACLFYAVPSPAITVPAESASNAPSLRDYLHERASRAHRSGDRRRAAYWQAVTASATHGPRGELVATRLPARKYFRAQVRLAMNLDPDLFADKDYQCPNLARYLLEINRRFPKAPYGLLGAIEYGERHGYRIDGAMIDMLGSSSLDTYNYRRDHFRYADVPLTFDRNGAVCIYNSFSTFEFLRYLWNLMASQQRYVAGNTVNKLYYYWYAPWLDYPASEVGYSPEPDSVFNFRRAMNPRKSFTVLMVGDSRCMTDNFRKLSRPQVRQYFEQCTFYAIYPGWHDAAEVAGDPKAVQYYWTTPDLYERDRPLYRLYPPIITRLLQAGWQPVTYAYSGQPDVFVERYGPGDDGLLYFTVWNDSLADQPVLLTIEDSHLNVDFRHGAKELVSGEAVTLARSDKRLKLRDSIEPRRVKVYCMRCRERQEEQ